MWHPRFTAILSLGIIAATCAADESAHRSHAPQRPLSVVRQFNLTAGPKLFVDPVRGDDAHPGTEAAPWKSVAYAVKRLSPGDTVYLRGGIYYERFAIDRSGTEQSPITISGKPFLVNAWTIKSTFLYGTRRDAVT